MTLAQLRYFCTAARYRSISKAATMLYVTQPAVSIAIRSLEKEFSMILFHHNGNKITLTEEGDIFYRRASAILSDCDELRGEYSGKDAAFHHVVLGIPPLLSTIFFPELIDSFHVDYPDTWIELHEYGSLRACDLIRDDLLDIGLVNMEFPEIDRFHTLPLLQDPLMFCVSRSHPLASADTIDLAQLDRQPVILLNRDSVHNQVLQSRFDALEISPRILMHSSQITTILSFLRKGTCGCFFYKSMLPLFPELKGLSIIPAIDTRIGLVWKRGRHLSRGMNEFIDFCRAYYGNT